MYKSSDNDDQIFCSNIIYLRKKNGLSKKRMAQMLGIGLHSLNLLETGIIPPRLGISIVFAIYQHFGLLPSTMFSCRLYDV